jgi:hypothetical protein
MGTITKNNTGCVSVSYNRVRLSEVDEQVFKYAIASFSHLINQGQQLCFTQFCHLITQQFAAEGKTKLCLEVLKKAAFTRRFLCNFRFLDVWTGQYRSGEAVIEVEQWISVQTALEHRLDASIIDLEIKGVSCVYRKGSLTYDDRSQVMSPAVQNIEA